VFHVTRQSGVEVFGRQFSFYEVVYRLFIELDARFRFPVFCCFNLWISSGTDSR
jgi:hypothetical protein